MPSTPGPNPGHLLLQQLLRSVKVSPSRGPGPHNGTRRCPQPIECSADGQLRVWYTKDKYHVMAICDLFAVLSARGASILTTNGDLGVGTGEQGQLWKCPALFFLPFIFQDGTVVQDRFYCRHRQIEEGKEWLPTHKQEP